MIDGYDFNRRGGYFSGKGDRKNGNPKPRADTQKYGLHIVKLIDHMGVKTIHAAVVHDLHVENRVLLLGNQDKSLLLKRGRIQIRAGSGQRMARGQNQTQSFRMGDNGVKLITVRQHIHIQKMKVIMIFAFFQQSVSGRHVCDVHNDIGVLFPKNAETLG